MLTVNHYETFLYYMNTKIKQCARLDAISDVFLTLHHCGRVTAHEDLMKKIRRRNRVKLYSWGGKTSSSHRTRLQVKLKFQLTRKNHWQRRKSHRHTNDKLWPAWNHCIKQIILIPRVLSSVRRMFFGYFTVFSELISFWFQSIEYKKCL